MKSITLEAGKYYMIDGYVSPELIYIIDIYDHKGWIFTTRKCTYRKITILGSNGLIMNDNISTFKNIIKEIPANQFTLSTISL